MICKMILYLVSKHYEMALQKFQYYSIDQLGGYPSGSYGVWSSTEYDEINSYVMSFDGNGNWVTLRKSHGFYIKAIRYF